MAILSNPIFHDATKAREWLERELWPNGPVCPHCGAIDEATQLRAKHTAPASISATLAANNSPSRWALFTSAARSR